MLLLWSRTLEEHREPIFEKWLRKHAPDSVRGGSK
jgi:hypothetical protein